MDQGTELNKLALFGQPVKSSLSPSIHRMFADQLGLDIEYQAIEAGPADFPRVLEAFRSGGGAGCNITLPLKGDAWRLAAASSEAANRAQAANTLVRQSSGWFAHNTDGAGLLADLITNHGIAIEGMRILVLGAGGAVAGILGSLLDVRPARVILVNRDQTRARVLAERFGLGGEDVVIGWAELLRAGGFDLIVNATSLGHSGGTPPLVKGVFAPGAVCYDLNYHHASEPLKTWCDANAQRYIDGLGMLVEQAVASFEIWTGKQPRGAEIIGTLRKRLG